MTSAERNLAAVPPPSEPAPSRKAADPHLDRIAEQLAQTDWAADLVDAEWNLVWVSDQLRALIGAEDDAELGVGQHLMQARRKPPWWNCVTPESRQRWILRNGGYIAHDTPGGVDRMRELAAPEDIALIDQIEPQEPPPAWASTADFIQGDLPPAPSRCITIRHEVDGRLVGTSFIYGAALPATLLAMLTRGDTGMFERMARLFEPARRSAAILFVDLCSSSALSRRLPTSAYFRLVRAIMTGVDQVIASHGGIVGKHVGDGATGFFLSDDLGSDSAAARASVEAAREVSKATHDVARDLAAEGMPVSPEEVAVRSGAHWGDALYMGQVVTGGRLEVSALGDEVNECARIEQSADEREALVSKVLIERLIDDDARGLGVDPGRLRYHALAEIDGADEKVRSDAGGVAVTDLADGSGTAGEADTAAPRPG
jgi:class 3 adenylate cyclase